MITKPTVFILGAGASAPYGYPVGAALKNDICLNFGRDMETLHKKSNSISNEALDFVETIPEFTTAFRNSRIKSIDRWLSLNPRYREIGKLAITNAIIKHENKTQLYFEGTQDKSDDWFSLLFNQMIRGTSCPDDFLKNQATFVTFNYDRLLEQLFFESLENTFSEFRPDEVGQMLSHFDKSIFHVYGTIGESPLATRDRRYSKDWNLTHINKARAGIHIINERTSTANIMSIIGQAKSIYFLGFGYDDENLQVIGFSKGRHGVKGTDIFGTALGLLPEEIRPIKIIVKIGTFCEIESCDCTTLLRKYLPRVVG
jgi:hypothetical protein